MGTNPNQSQYTIEKKAIRRYFYLGFILAIILPSFLLLSIYSTSLQNEYQSNVQQLSTNILAEKKRLLRNNVDLVIYFIEAEIQHMQEESDHGALSQKDLKLLAKERISETIRNLRLEDEGYVWVNQIVDYKGGDNYAIRLIHPNLPETEGQWLSTNTQDSQGNYPYQTELQGVKAKGELYFEYYFKKMGSDKSGRKISYAKLYAPFDWVIATGIYLDDIEQLVASETSRMRAAYESQWFNSVIILLLTLLISFLVILLFEKRIQNLILSYEAKLQEYTKSLEKLSVTDRLTKLYNRFKLDGILEQELIRASRYGTTFSILIIDIDWFKKINDELGHQVGDQVLKQFAKLLLNNARSADTVARWGGEEFMIVCPETCLEGARLSAEKIRTVVASHVFPNELSLTCSIGISTFDKNDQIEALVKRADNALYRAKSNGRNRVETQNLLDL